MKYVLEDRGHVTPCWVWQQELSTQGYGQVMLLGVRHQAHRIYYEMHVGRIPPGRELDHLCRVRACVNPDHLEPVTHAENARRGANTKLSPAEAYAIRTAKGSERATVLAETYGVSVRLVYSIWQRQAWADLR